LGKKAENEPFFTLRKRWGGEGGGCPKRNETGLSPAGGRRSPSVEDGLEEKGGVVMYAGAVSEKEDVVLRIEKT